MLRPAVGPTQPRIQWYWGVSLRGLSGRGLNPHKVSRLRMSGAIFLLLHVQTSCAQEQLQLKLTFMLSRSLSPQHGAYSGCRWRVAVNVLIKHWRTADRGWYYDLGFGGGNNDFLILKPTCCRNENFMTGCSSLRLWRSLFRAVSGINPHLCCCCLFNDAVGAQMIDVVTVASGRALALCRGTVSYCTTDGRQGTAHSGLDHFQG
jgi:hypothetical protein